MAATPQLPLAVRMGAAHSSPRTPPGARADGPSSQRADGESSSAAHAGHVAEETAKALAPQPAPSLTVGERRTVVHVYPEFTLEFQESVAASLGVNRMDVLRALGRAAPHLRSGRSVPNLDC